MNSRSHDRESRIWLLLFAAWIFALVSSLSALFIGEVMGQAPCNLCWFQRAFMFPLVFILGAAALLNDGIVWRYALPTAVAGWLVAAFHNLLYFGIVPESIKPCADGPSCSDSNMTIFGTLPLPLLSLVVFSLIIVLLVAIRKGLQK
ncbi:MAG: disulfide bond formation protein B [Shinella sp.]|nr:MAG: disulfide bond formation protein B [Shinella sp.]